MEVSKGEGDGDICNSIKKIFLIKKIKRKKEKPYIHQQDQGIQVQITSDGTDQHGVTPNEMH